MHFDFHAEIWGPEGIDKLGDLLCKFSHWFAKDDTDLARVTMGLLEDCFETGGAADQTTSVPISDLATEGVDRD